jgi:hypothetical protein
MNHLRKIHVEISTLREQLIQHKMYANIKTIEDFQGFMEQHIFAVWDFMSLLKSLQRGLTSVEVPWSPVGSPTTRRFINEIVLGEESDIDSNGKVSSHFELYLDAMNQIGAKTIEIKKFITLIEEGVVISDALNLVAIQEETKEFVRFTFSIINTKELHRIAAVFTFGREDLIPDMFIEILREMKEQGQGNISKLLYYLERHIEIDGGDHGPISLKMIEELCQNDSKKWDEVLESTKLALEYRIRLWDGVQKKINIESLSLI